MGKFDGLLLCTDLDATLLNDDHKVSEENIRAIEYFKSEGGKFTFVTGRVPTGARLMLEYVKPNVPVVTFNGAGVYDFEEDKLLWGTYLEDGAKDLIEFVEKRIEGVGLVVCTDDKVYFPLLLPISPSHMRAPENYFLCSNVRVQYASSYHEEYCKASALTVHWKDVHTLLGHVF